MTYLKKKVQRLSKNIKYIEQSRLQANGSRNGCEKDIVRSYMKI